MRNAEGVIEHIDPRAVYERDHEICGICGEHVEPADISVDHIAPLSLGGQHTWENVRLAHLLCNVRRGNRLEWTVQRVEEGARRSPPAPARQRANGDPRSVLGVVS